MVLERLLIQVAEADNTITINTGSRGGQYYYNSKGNKVYVPKR